MFSEAARGLDTTLVPKLEETCDGLFDGEIKLMSTDGKVSAFEWKKDKWSRILSANFYQGDSIFEPGEYDFIFDVQIEGKLLKLPCNKHWSLDETAQLFCAREGFT